MQSANRHARPAHASAAFCYYFGRPRQGLNLLVARGYRGRSGTDAGILKLPLLLAPRDRELTSADRLRLAWTRVVFFLDDVQRQRAPGPRCPPCGGFDVGAAALRPPNQILAGSIRCHNQRFPTRLYWSWNFSFPGAPFLRSLHYGSSLLKTGSDIVFGAKAVGQAGRQSRQTRPTDVGVWV